MRPTSRVEAMWAVGVLPRGVQAAVAKQSSTETRMAARYQAGEGASNRGAGCTGVVDEDEEPEIAGGIVPSTTKSLGGSRPPTFCAQIQMVARARSSACFAPCSTTSPWQGITRTNPGSAATFR